MTITYGGSLASQSVKTTGTTLTISGGSSVPIGSTVIITYAGLGNIATISASDNGGNTYVTDFDYSAGTVTTAIIRGVITSAFTTITVTQSSSNSGRVAGADYFSSDGVIQFVTTAQGSGSSTAPTATISAGKPGLFIGVIGVNGPTVAPSVAPSWNPLTAYSTGTTGGSVASNVYQYAGYLITAGTSGTYNATMTTSRAWQDIIVAYNEQVAVSKTLTDTVTINDVTQDTVVDILEDFEDDTFNFNFSGAWVRSNSISYQGSWSYTNPDINDSQSTATSFTVSVPTGAANPKISFYYDVSSETGYDFFNVYINGVQQLHQSGGSGFVYWEYPLNVGSNTIQFEYKKDSSASGGLDAVFIDSLRMTYSIPFYFTSKGYVRSVADTLPVSDVTSSLGNGYYYAMNQGSKTGEYLRVTGSAITYTDVEIDMIWGAKSSVSPVSQAFFTDYGSPSKFAYSVTQISSAPTVTGGITTYINGTVSTTSPTENSRIVLKLSAGTTTHTTNLAPTSGAYFGADSGFGNWASMKIFRIRFYNLGTVVADFNYYNGTLTDQTGNGYTLTSLGGALVKDGVIGKVTGKSPIESIPVTDSMTKSTGATSFNLTLTDNISPGDTISKKSSISKTETISVGGEGGTALTFVESDGADVINITKSQALSDSFSTSDTITVRKIATRSLTDSVALGESFVKQRIKTLTDAVASTETFKKQFNIAYTDSVTGTDSMATLVVKTKALTDSISSSDTLGQVKTKTLTDSISSGDSVSIGGTHNYTVTLTDAIGTTDSVTKVVAAKKSLSDPVGTSDTITKKLVATKSDPISTSDSVAKAQLTTKSLSDSITESDSLAKVKTKMVTDAIGTSDSIVASGKSYSETDTISSDDTVAKKFTKTLTESVVTSESITKAAKTKKLTDTINTNDLVSVGNSHAYAVALTDSIGTTDSMTKGNNAFRTLSDSVATSDTQYDKKSMTITESISTTDSLAKRLSTTKTLTESIGTSDTVTKLNSAVRTLTDSVATADSQYDKKSMTITESIGTSDTVTKLNSSVRTLTDSVATADTSNEKKSMSINESISTSDSLSKARTKTLTDSISSGDSLSTGSTHNFAVTLTDSIGTTDSLAKVVAAYKALTDSVGTADTSYEKKSMTIAETITGTDTVKKLKAVTLSDTMPQSDTVRKLKSVTFAENIATSDTIGQAKTKKLTDSISSNDSLATGSTHIFTVTLTDSIGTTDSVAKIITAFRTVSDSVATADTSYEKKSMTVADSITETDTVTKLKSVTFTENIATSDTIGQAKTKKLTDSISSNDNLSAGGTHNFATTLTDSIGTSDTVTKLNSSVRTLTDSVATADTSNEKKSMSINESISTTDSVAKRITAFRALTDTVPTADTSNEKKSMSMTDSITETDTVKKLKAVTFIEAIGTSDTSNEATTRKLTDSISTNDTLMTSNSHYMAVSLADSISTSDSVVKAKPVALADAVTTADTEYEKKSMIVSDSIGTTDSITKRLATVKTISDSVATNDTENDKTSKTFTEGVNTSDTVAKKLSTVKSDTVTSSDSMTPQYTSGIRNWTLTLTDTIPTSDSVMSGAAFARSVTLSDSVIVSETVAKRGTKSVADSVASGDTPRKLYSKPLSDTQGFNDSIAKLLRRGLTDSVTNADTAAKGANFPRTYSDTISTSDNAIGRNVVHRITFNDSILAEDYIYQIVKRYMSLAEVILQNDSIGGAGTNTINASDTVAMTDSIKKQIIRNRADSVSTSDSIGKLFSTTRLDTFVLQDYLYKQSAKQKTDSMAISEALSKMLGKTKSDSISTGDTEGKTGKINIYDGMFLEDYLYRAYKHGVTFNDSIPVSDSKGSGVGNTRSLQDSITLSDGIFKQLGKLRADSINLGESSKETYGRVFPEIIAIQDYLYTVIRRAILINDNVGVGDLTGSGGGKAVGITDTITLVETLTKKLVKMRTDSIAAGDTEKAQATKALIDYIKADDVLFKQLSQFKPESVNLADTRQGTRGKILVDTVPAVDTLTRSRLQNVYLYDLLFATDSPLALLLGTIPIPIDVTAKPIVLNVEITRLINIILDR